MKIDIINRIKARYTMFKKFHGKLNVLQIPQKIQDGNIVRVLESTAILFKTAIIGSLNPKQYVNIYKTFHGFYVVAKYSIIESKTFHDAVKEYEAVTNQNLLLTVFEPAYDKSTKQIIMYEVTIEKIIPNAIIHATSPLRVGCDHFKISSCKNYYFFYKKTSIFQD